MTFVFLGGELKTIWENFHPVVGADVAIFCRRDFSSAAM